MTQSPVHSFHIPVMGLGFTIDTPVKVAHFGISSVISIMEDGLIEQMRKHHCSLHSLPYTPIPDTEEDYRAKRITAYLDVVQMLVTRNVESLRRQPFEPGTDIVKYFELLPETSELKSLYRTMLHSTDLTAREALQQELRSAICAGSIDVNVMSKVDGNNFAGDGTALPKEYSDAMAALRGFARSTLRSSIVFSAGYNPRLYAYIASFDDFFPDANGVLRKKITLKVSDYRSAAIQGKLLAKKGLWVSEFRIESGLNCGGHAFPTQGLLLGPILEEFKMNRPALSEELFAMCNRALAAAGKKTFPALPGLRLTVQGGIGTSHEDRFLMDHFGTNGTGWGSPFLLVPEVTNVDEETLLRLADARPEDYYLSDASPLGFPFNNFKKSTSELQRQARIAEGKPGSPCEHKFLCSDTEFTEKPICTASIQYQRLKIQQLNRQHLSVDEFRARYKEITDKECLCTGLSSSALISHNIEPKSDATPVAICPGPNLAYFSGIFSLKQMVDHIYGRTNILNSVKRPNMFINELGLYVKYLKKEIDKSAESLNNDKIRYLRTFQSNLLEGVQYYKSLDAQFAHAMAVCKEEFNNQLNEWEEAINDLFVPVMIETEALLAV